MTNRWLKATAILLVLAGCGQGEPKTEGGPPVMRRLTEEQYRQIIADVFGRAVVVGGRFDPLNRANGLLAVGAGTTAINGSALDRYDALARSVAGQVLAVDSRDMMVPCKPAALDKADEACAAAFFSGVGRLLYRRPLPDKEVANKVALAGAAATKLGDFYAGLGAGLSAMLVSPEFLFITDATEPDPANSGARRLTGHAKAARLSFLIWNSTPDDALLTAAENGSVHTQKGLEAQVNRLLGSPRFAGGVRAFFTDMLAFDAFETMEKDPEIYPAFSLKAINGAREQALRTIVDLVVDRNGDYRDLFTTRATFLNRPLGMVYRVPINDPDGWVRYEFPAGDQHIGIQSQVGFVALHSHPGRSSATLRGKAVRELLMCQKVPDPPPNVDFTLVSDSANPIYKTARQRLGAHSTDPTCAGCHRLMDPIGLTLENFDGAGQWRTAENGQPIDAGGELDGVTYADAAGLAKTLHDNPAIPSCVVNRLFGYASGRTPAASERAWISYLEKDFAGGGYRVADLVRRIALSNAFYAVAVPETSHSVRDEGLPDKEGKS